MNLDRKPPAINGMITTFAVVTVALCLLPACNSGVPNSEAVAILSAAGVNPGQTTFEANCIGCHPYGKRGRGPNLSRKELTAERVREKIRKGGLFMPSFSEEKIDNEELTQVAEFVATLNQKIGKH